jgi:hypothetical protein
VKKSATHTKSPSRDDTTSTSPKRHGRTGSTVSSTGSGRHAGSDPSIATTEVPSTGGTTLDDLLVLERAGSASPTDSKDGGDGKSRPQSTKSRRGRSGKSDGGSPSSTTDPNDPNLPSYARPLRRDSHKSSNESSPVRVEGDPNDANRPMSSDGGQPTGDIAELVIRQAPSTVRYVSATVHHQSSTDPYAAIPLPGSYDDGNITMNSAYDPNQPRPKSNHAQRSAAAAAVRAQKDADAHQRGKRRTGSAGHSLIGQNNSTVDRWEGATDDGDEDGIGSHVRRSSNNNNNESPSASASKWRERTPLSKLEGGRGSHHQRPGLARPGSTSSGTGGSRSDWATGLAWDCYRVVAFLIRRRLITEAQRSLLIQLLREADGIEGAWQLRTELMDEQAEKERIAMEKGEPLPEPLELGPPPPPHIPFHKVVIDRYVTHMP